MSEAKMCACGDRPADQCDEEWGPDCDLGNNPKHVARHEASPEDMKIYDSIVENYRKDSK